MTYIKDSNSAQKIMEEKQAALKKLQDVGKNIEAKHAKVETKSDEAMHTTNTNNGGELDQPGHSNRIIDLVTRNEESVLSQLQVIDMPQNPYVMPVATGDPTWNFTAENEDVPGTEHSNSKVATDNPTLTAKKFTVNTYVSGELQEDAVASVTDMIEAKIVNSLPELLDRVMINGDTTTAGTGNVNSDDGAPAAGSYYLALDGFRKAAIDNSLTENAGTLDLTDFRDLRALLGYKGVKPADCLLLMEYQTYLKALSLAEVGTMEKFGVQATVTNGVLKKIDGVKIIVNKDMGLTEADGKQSTTGSNNTLGQAVMIYKPEIIAGFRRQLQIIPEYLPEYDQFRINAHVRFAFKILTTSAVASMINITV